MVDKKTKDWQDVFFIRDALLEGKTIYELKPTIANLSHLKYPVGGSKGLHDARQKYRKWVIKMALNEVKLTKGDLNERM